MGILNVTPDSFSDGGVYTNAQQAIEHAHRMLEEGALIIDVGGESTRPGAAPVTSEEELARVLPVVEALSRQGVCVSIDTRHPDVAAACVQAGAAIINDVSGFRDADMVRVAANCNAGLVVMHMQGEPGTMQDNPTYTDVVAEVRSYLAEQARMLEDAGVDASRICIDPGPGFGKTASQTLELVRNFQEFARLGYPVCVAVSRKSYIGEAYGIKNPTERDEASAIEARMACELGASIVRTHNVETTKAQIETMRPYVFVALGSNVALVADPGEEQAGKVAMLNQALTEMALLPDTQLIDVSSFYESEPAYKHDQDDFVNAVALLRTSLAPRDLLHYLHAIENNLGRVRHEANGPRTCDLDILDYQLYVSDDEELTLPHPRILERDFVVKPLLEVRPGHILADGTPVTANQVTCGTAHLIS